MEARQLLVQQCSALFQRNRSLCEARHLTGDRPEPQRCGLAALPCRPRPGVAVVEFSVIRTQCRSGQSPLSHTVLFQAPSRPFRTNKPKRNCRPRAPSLPRRRRTDPARSIGCTSTPTLDASRTRRRATSYAPRVPGPGCFSRHVGLETITLALNLAPESSRSTRRLPTLSLRSGFASP